MHNDSSVVPAAPEPSRIAMAYSGLLLIVAAMLWFARDALASFLFALVIVYILLPAVTMI